MAEGAAAFLRKAKEQKKRAELELLAQSKGTPPSSPYVHGWTNHDADDFDRSELSKSSPPSTAVFASQPSSQSRL